ncbi:asparaginase [Ornithobacterium rhinotracheale]|uniref:asparaginase n=1 Tax=Ornithobacterium rhinotracheale TaxID=28251 RepID=UPI00129C31C8|nr:asparaginase [Ornithobacterium rhinotracheale]MRJ10042.1 asparaginase [Ornithobacterium rhinotracheale]
MARILLIYTGGTIGMVRDYQTKSLRPFNFSNLLERIPEIKLIEATLDTVTLGEPIDSSDMSIPHWQGLINLIDQNYNAYDGFVVLHGTDTMAYTASALSFAFKGLSKPIIFTGSQLPIGDLRTDAKENLISSIHYATLQRDARPIIKEVCIYFEYKLYRANRTTKKSANHFDAFASPNFPNLGESGVEMELNEDLLFKSSEKYSVNDNFSSDVGLLKIFPGMNHQFLYDCVGNINLKALVLEAFGSGNIFNDEKFNHILAKRIDEGLNLIVLSQCFSGEVNLGKYSASSGLLTLGAVSGKDITTEAAITKSMSLLSKNIDRQTFKKEFEKNICGEIK